MWLNRSMVRTEVRFGRIAMALFVGLISFLLVAVYIGPSYEPAYLGFEYARLSNAPFDISTPNMLRLRIFGPLLGYLTFLRGPIFVLLPWIFLVALLALCYYNAREEGLLPINALLTAAITFSCTAFVTLYAPGYTDSITYFFVLLCLLRRIPNRWKAFAFALAVCNHESALILLPAVVYVLWLDRKSVIQPFQFFGWLALFLVPYILYRVWATGADPSVLAPKYYFTTANVKVNYRELGPTLWGLFWAFRVMWLLPLAAFVIGIHQRRYAVALIYPLIIFPVCCQELIAHDTTRLMALAFPAVLLSCGELHQRWGPQKFGGIVATLLAINFLIPPKMVVWNDTYPMRKDRYEKFPDALDPFANNAKW